MMKYIKYSKNSEMEKDEETEWNSKRMKWMNEKEEIKIHAWFC